MLRDTGHRQPVVQSILDRLTDLEPKAQEEVPLTYPESLRQLKQGLRRDLEWLLNTRRIATPPDDSWRELNRSAHVYGMPDLSSFSMSDPADHERLQRAIQTIVRLFEPRISNPTVATIDGGEDTNQVLRFRI